MPSMKIAYVLAFAILLSSAAVPAVFSQVGTEAEEETGLLSTDFSPGFGFPLGDSSDYWNSSVTGSLGLTYEFRSAAVLLGGAVDYSLYGTDADYGVSIAGASLRSGYRFRPSPRLPLDVTVFGGFSYGSAHSSSGGSGTTWNIGGGTSIGFLLTPTVDLALWGDYRYQFGLYQGLAVGIRASFFLMGRDRREEVILASKPLRSDILEGAKTAPPGQGLILGEPVVERIYPVFYKYYEEYPLGSIPLTNLESTAVEDVQATFYIRQFMDAPFPCPLEETLGGKAEVSLDLFAVFSNEVMAITEEDKAIAEIAVTYTMDGERYKVVETVPVDFANRNALTWDDDRKAAAFVTPRDDVVISYARQVNRAIKDRGSQALSPAVLSAMGQYTALGLYGLEYVIDPSSSYIELSSTGGVQDYVQFPVQTLERQGGDCDDLTVLYCSLLESLGIETAFLTVPGHILPAFNTGIPANDVGIYFSSVEEVIFHGDEIWIPVEMTDRSSGFLDAWAIGARSWREHNRNAAARLYPVRTSWELYSPVFFAGDAPQAEFPDEMEVLSAFVEEMVSYVEREISPQVTELEERLRRDGPNPVVHNKLGILYARYGLIDQARDQFDLALERGEYPPALMNRGNISYLKEEWEEAITYYERVLLTAPDNSRAQLGIARANHQMGNAWKTQSAYLKLTEMSPELADKYAYLGSGSGVARAGTGNLREESVLWSDE